MTRLGHGLYGSRLGQAATFLVRSGPHFRPGWREPVPHHRCEPFRVASCQGDEWWSWSSLVWMDVLKLKGPYLDSDKQASRESMRKPEEQR